jgi:hypothetical protein
LDIFKLEDSGGKRTWLAFREDQDPSEAFASFRRFLVPYPFSVSNIPRLADQWVPIKVEIANPKAPCSDFPSIQGPPVFSARAGDALREFLGPNGELLPLDCAGDGGPFHAYHVTAVIDALDLDDTDADWRDPDAKTSARFFRRMSFRADRLSGASVFQIPQDLHSVWVTDGLVQRVAQARLLGFRFTKVWPA